MEDFSQKETKGNPVMRYKVYLEDYSNIVEVCTKKCINNYSEQELNPLEKLCLEKCFVKSLNMNDYVADEFPNIINKYE
jgi:hypothetical protein